MQDTRAGSAPPHVDTGSGADDVCPSCRHPKLTKPRRNLGIARRLGLRPRPASCPVQMDDDSGYTSACYCRHPSHGS